MLINNVHIDPDLGPDAVQEQLRTSLFANAVRVIDLFREWDIDNDGQISREEFAHALPLLGIQTTKSQTDALFDDFDTDGSGEISFKETGQAVPYLIVPDNKRGRDARNVLLMLLKLHSKVCPSALPKPTIIFDVSADGESSYLAWGKEVHENKELRKVAGGWDDKSGRGGSSVRAR